MLSGLFSAFMLHSWEATSVVAVAAGVVGFFVVLRGSTFAAHAIPQGAFTGAAAAALLGTSTLLGAGVFSFLAVGALARWGRRGRHDVVTALVLVIMLATGSLFLSVGSQYAQQTFSLLFGEPLAVSSAYLWPTVGLAAACTGLVLVSYRRLLLTSAAPELAGAGGVSPAAVNFWFLLAIGAATTLALPVVGALLVFSLMIGPPAAARSLTARPGVALGLSVLLALVTTWAALVGAYWSNWPLGFFVGVAAVLWYLLGRGAKAWGHRPRTAPAVGSSR